MAKGENIFLRKDGRFEARYAKGRDGNGKLIYGFCYGRTYEEAREKVRRAIRELAYDKRGVPESIEFRKVPDRPEKSYSAIFWRQSAV